MGFTLENVVPWGRSYDEYVAMFSLSKADLQKNILGCGDGPASFNAELTKRGGKVVSVDPVYRLSTDDIRTRIGETYEKILEQAELNKDDYIWETIKSTEELGKIRMAAMEQFLLAFQQDRSRYIAGELPALPFDSHRFDIALCSHFLFLYSSQYSTHFHCEAVRELCRVACEVRIFPLLELGGKRSRHVRKVMEGFAEEGYLCKIQKVPYEFQKGGNEMLVIQSSR